MRLVSYVIQGRSNGFVSLEIAHFEIVFDSLLDVRLPYLLAAIGGGDS